MCSAGLGSGFDCADVGVLPRELGPRNGGISGIAMGRTEPLGVGLRCCGVMSKPAMSSAMDRWMYSSYA